MKRFYICYDCGFPFTAEEDNIPKVCPSCSATSNQFLSEPYNETGKRRIHVDPPVPDPNWDPMNTAYHHPKTFPENSRHGQVRRFILSYDDAQSIKEFYSDIFEWDIFDTMDSDPNNPLMYCATGPGTSDWEPRVPSFIYGYLRSRQLEDLDQNPRLIIEVDDLDATLEKVIEFGGKLLKDQFFENGNLYVIIEDSEGTAICLWQNTISAAE